MPHVVQLLQLQHGEKAAGKFTSTVVLLVLGLGLGLGLVVRYCVAITGIDGAMVRCTVET